MKNDFYMDMVSKSIISRLSEEIAGNLGAQINTLIKELLNNELSGVLAGQMKTGTDLLKNEISGNAKVNEKAVNDLKKYIEENIVNRDTEDDNQRAVLQEELAAVKQAVEESKKEQIDLLKGIIENQLSGLNEKIDIAFEDMRDGMSQADENAGMLIKESNNDIKEYIEENIVKRDKEGGNRFAGLADKIEASIKDMKEGMARTDEKNRTFIDESSHKIMNYIEDNIVKSNKKDDEKRNILREELAHIISMLDDARLEQKDLIGNDLISLLKMIVTLLENVKAEMSGTGGKYGKEQNEMLSGVFYSVKKLLTLYNKDKEGSEQNAMQSVSALNEIKQHMEDTTEKHLQITKDSAEKVSSQLMNDFRNMKKYMDNYMKQNSGTDGQSNSTENVLMEIKRAMEGREKEQNDLLNGVFYSIKKLTNSYKKEKDYSDNTAIQFQNTLEVLYGHIRRLESEKDELSVDLMRLAGDDYLKNKFAELEKELKKAKSRAEKYQKDNFELEDRMKDIQQQWDTAAAAKG